MHNELKTNRMAKINDLLAKLPLDKLGVDRAVAAMRERGWSPWWLALLPGALLVWLLVWLMLPAEPVEAGKVMRGTATRAVFGTVVVEPTKEALVHNRTAGVIRKVNVKQGDRIEQDGILAEISNESLDIELANAQNAVETAKRRLEIGPPSQQELQTRKAELEQVTKLYKQELIAKIELDRAAGTVKDLEQRVERERLLYLDDLSRAQKQLDDVTSRVNQGLIKAPLAGVVLDVLTNPGESMPAQTLLFRIGTQTNRLRASINEEDVGVLSPGLEAMVRLYSFSDQSFKAKLTEILPQAQNQVYSTILELEKPPDNLLPGMSGELNIVVGQHPNSLIIPRRAIFDKTFVYVVEGRKVRKREIKTGYRSTHRAEVLEGLKEGEIVILSEQDRFKPGSRVKPILTDWSDAATDMPAAATKP
jgi:RND family efflux transporter MFP subunit